MTALPFANDLQQVKLVPKHRMILKLAMTGILLVISFELILKTDLFKNSVDLVFSLKVAKMLVVASTSLVVLFLVPKAFQSSLLEKEDEFKSLFKNNSDPLWIYDSETLGFLGVNEGAIKMYGYSREEFMALKITDIMHAPHLSGFTKIAKGSKRTYLNSGMRRHKKKNGSFLLADITSYKINFQGKKSRLEVVHDVTRQIVQQELANFQQQSEKKVKEPKEELQFLHKELELRNKEVYAVNEDLIKVNDLLQIANKNITEISKNKAEQFSRILDTVSDVLWSFDLTGKGDNYLSASASEKYGRPLEELVKDPFFWKEYIHPDDLHILVASQERLDQTGQSDSTYRITDKDQRVRWIYNRERLLKNNNGSATRIEGISTDVSYVMQAERIIEEQEFRFRAVFENLDMGIAIVDLDGKILLFNKLAEKMNNFFKKSIAIGVDVKDLVCPEHRTIIRDIFQKVVNTKASWHCKVKYLNRLSNEPHYFSINYSPVLNIMGEVIQVCIMARDITRETLTDEKLKREKNLLRTLIDNLPDYVYVKDKELKHIINNRANVKLIGARTERETLGKTVAEYFPSETANKFIEEDQEILSSGKPITNKEEELTDIRGQKHCLLTSKIPLRDKRGRVTGIVGISRDITELTEYKKSLERKVQERTRELNDALAKEREVVEMKNRFVSMASHEFRTPLSTIHFAAGFIKKFHNKISPEELQNKLAHIESQVNNMTGLLDDVLTIGKSESGKIKIDFSSVDLIQFLDKIIEDVKQSSGNTHVIEKNFSCSPIIASDEKFLRNIFINLITNAIKFSPERNKIFVDVKTDGNHVFISVKDQGIGIAPSDLVRIFEPFQRGSNVVSIQGTGLGLSIVKKAVELLKGEIQVQSKAGDGSEFIVNFPVRSNESPSLTEILA